MLHSKASFRNKNACVTAEAVYIIRSFPKVALDVRFTSKSDVSLPVTHAFKICLCVCKRENEERVAAAAAKSLLKRPLRCYAT